MSMSLTRYPCDEEEVVRLTAAEVKKYESQFSQAVVRFSNLQFNESVGEGINTYGMIHNWCYCAFSVSMHTDIP